MCISFENKICSKKFLVYFCIYHIHFCSPRFPQKFNFSYEGSSHVKSLKSIGLEELIQATSILSQNWAAADAALKFVTENVIKKLL